MSGDSSSVDESIVYLIQGHPELKSFQINNGFSCTDKSLKALFSQPNLEIIRLSDCAITGEVGFETRPKLALKVLGLTWCEILTDIGLVQLLNMTDGISLTELDLSRTCISFSNIHLSTAFFRNLEVLNLGCCYSLTDDGVISFLRLTEGRLKKLDLGCTSISFSNVESLSMSLSRLEELELNFCDNLSETGVISFLKQIGGCLNKLNLGGNSLSLSNVDSMTNRFTKLKVLELNNSLSLSETGFISLLSKVGDNLTRLNLQASNISLSGVELLSSRLPLLEELLLFACRNLTDNGFISLLNRVGDNLKTLNVGSTSISLSNMDSLSTRFPRVEKLVVSYCRNLTEAGAISLLSKVGEELRVLDLKGTPISLSSAGSLTNSFPRLEELSLFNCVNVAEPGVIALLNKTGDSLQTLNIRGTNLAADSIRAHFPGIRLIYC